jgi:uncharacterized membrane protein YphA (DoxX/SURF4 family)
MSDNQSKQAFWGYCVTTAILCLVMVGGGVSDLLKIDQMKEVMDTLGYPAYLMTILGVAKLLGAVAILVPGFARLKEWAYAGFTFDLLGASISHAAVGEPIPQIIIPIVFLIVAIASWALRPDSRKLPSSAPAA